MKPEQCSFCKGVLYNGKTEFIARVGDEILSVKDVPAYICENCHEAYYAPDISRKIDSIMQNVHHGKFLAHPIAAGELEFESNWSDK